MITSTRAQTGGVLARKSRPSFRVHDVVLRETFAVQRMDRRCDEPRLTAGATAAIMASPVRISNTKLVRTASNCVCHTDDGRIKTSSHENGTCCPAVLSCCCLCLHSGT